MQSPNISDKTELGQPSLVSVQQSSSNTNRQPSQRENVSTPKHGNQTANIASINIDGLVPNDSLLIARNRHSVATPSDSGTYRSTLERSTTASSFLPGSSKSATPRASQSTEDHLLNLPTRTIPVATGRETISNGPTVGKFVIYS